MKISFYVAQKGINIRCKYILYIAKIQELSKWNS